MEYGRQTSQIWLFLVVVKQRVYQEQIFEMMLEVPAGSVGLLRDSANLCFLANGKLLKFYQILP